MVKIQLIVATASVLVFGTISGDYFRGWSIDLMYGTLAVYPLYLTWKTPNFRPVLYTGLIWAFGRLFQFADLKTMFTYSISAYGLLSLYYIRHGNIHGMRLAATTSLYGVAFAAISPAGWFLYLMQLVWNLMYLALLHMPVAKNGKEEGEGHRYYVEDAKKAA